MRHGELATLLRRHAAVLFAAGAAVAVSACAGGRAAQVSPEEIPALQERLAREPNNGEVVLRYAAALFTAGLCDSARVVATNGIGLAPQNALGPLVAGQCLEQAGEWDQALVAYRRFLAAHPDGRGSGAVRARETLALRSRANRRAQEALARESDLAQQPGDPQTLAVLPIDIAGDSMYRPLSRGLAEMMTSDLALLQRFRLVERMQVSALLDELALAESERVDAGTAARVGRLLQAGRMVQGLAQIPGEQDVRLEASIVRSDGEVLTASGQSGRLRDLLRMEKDVVIGIAGQLGYALSEAERRSILENGTQSLAAFLAYSRGLEAEDLGDYSAAAAYYADAARQDPGFTAARTGFSAATSAVQAQQAAPAQVTTVASEPPPAPVEAVPEVTEGATQSTVVELAGTQSEQATAALTNTGTSTGSQTNEGSEGSNTVTSAPTATVTTVVNNPNITGTVRIVFRLP